MAVSSDPRIGTELLGYRIDAVLGQGGMGVVYRGHDPRLKRDVALKLLSPELDRDPRFRERFLRESELAASLEHPNVVPIHDVGEAEGRLFIVMRLVEGRDLKTLLREEGKLAPERALAIVSQVADALDAAHARGLVHRDVKPSNVLLDAREHAYLADFGLTRRRDDPGALASAGLSLGTPAYIAPEQIEGSEVDERADQYSLACLLYECLSGRPPFPRASDVAVLFAHLEEAPPPLAGLEKVLEKGLAKRPGDRYASCGELVQSARDALGIVGSKRARWPFVVAGLGAAVLAAALLAFALESNGGGPIRVEGNAVAEIDARSGKVVAQIPVGARPEGIAATKGALWVANLDDTTVSHVDPVTGRVVRTLPVGDTPTGLAASSGVVWVVGSNPRRSSISVTRIDPRFDAAGPETRIPNVVTGGDGSVATHGRSVWITPSAGLLTRVNPRTGQVVQRIDPNAGPGGLAVGADAVWVTDTRADTVTRVDPTTSTLTPIAVGQGPRGIATGVGAVWVADSLSDAVTRIDSDTHHVTRTIPVGRAPVGIAVGAGSVWVANSQDGTVTRIDSATGDVVKTIQIGGSPQQIVVSEGRIWVTVQPESVGGPEAPRSGGTARLTQERDWDQTMDPALNVNDWRLQYATCAKLVNYPDTPVPAGLRLIPEVAESLPMRSADGKTYTFVIRKGFRFSPPSNEPVTAQTFKYSLERTLSPKMGSYGRDYYADIAGARAYMAGNATHIEGIVAWGGRLIIRLLAAAPDFLARLAMPYTCAVPLGTPLDPKGVSRIPMAGPYYLASFVPGQGAVFERNPNYGGKRPHRLDRIEVAFGVSSERAIRQIESGTTDFLLGSKPLPSSVVERIAARYGPGSSAAKRGEQQYFRHPRPGTTFLLFNTRRRLFRDVRLRRAVNYALDRIALARIGPPYNDPPGLPTDHYIPPGVPGFKDTSVYPSTPDVSAARRLTDGKQRTAVLYTCNELPCERLAREVRKDLRAIGLQVRIRAFSTPSLFARYAARGEPYDLALANWWLDYLDPADALDVVVKGGLGLPTPTLDATYKRKLDAAERLSGPRRYLAFAGLDADLARNAAPWAALFNGQDHDFFSARMGCRTYAAYGIDLAALCIKS